MNQWFQETQRNGLTLRVRAMLAVVGVFLLAFVVLFYTLVQVIERNQLDETKDELRSNASLAAYELSDQDAALERVPEVLLMDYADITNTRLTLIGSDGAVLFDSEPEGRAARSEAHQPEVIGATNAAYGWDTRTSGSMGERYLYVAVAVPGSDDLILRLSVPIRGVEADAASLMRTMLLAMAIPFLVSLAIVWFAGGRLFRPLQDLATQAIGVSDGDYSLRAPHYNVPELDSVGSAFNTMAIGLESSIRRQEQASLRLEAVMDGLFDGVILTDENRQILRMNPVAQTMFDASEAEAIGKPLVQVARDYEIVRVLTRAFDAKETATTTVDHGVDHLAIQVLARVVPGIDRPLGLLVMRDVTDIRRLELIRREFVANVSHELRTPLASIRAMVETLETGAVEDLDIAQDFLARIVVEIERLTTLLDDLLDFARLESGRTPLRLESVPLAEVLEHGLLRLREQIDRADLMLVLDFEENLPEVVLDIGRIEQVLINLVHNAIKFTPAGGTLTLRAWREKNKVLVSLRDTGVGIPIEEQARLFERFYKSDKARRSEGTGLGLAIAQNIVLLHGGRIWVESTPGHGAEFTFMLPLKRKKAEKRARKHTLRGLV